MMECIKPSRAAMRSTLLVFLIGSLFICCQVHAARRVFISELVVESNVTVEPQAVLSALNMTALHLTDSSGNPQTLNILQIELVAECSHVGLDTVCNCSNGYIWSNEVCYNFSCCREGPCEENVALIMPICVPKVEVRINGSVIRQSPYTAWDASKTAVLVSAFEGLNGFESLNVIGLRESNTIADFEALVSVKFPTSRLRDIVKTLESNLNARLLVDTFGMVNIEAPPTTVCYESTPELMCTFEEATDSAGWNMSKLYERFELNNGKVVELNHSCATDEYLSCTKVTLHNVTGLWEGTYECGFTIGSIRHTAKANMSVALLPDDITLKTDPLTIDCSDAPDSVKVTAIILNTSENFDVQWTYMSEDKPSLSNESYGGQVEYIFSVAVSCKTTKAPQSVTVTFKNSVAQKKSAKVDIPVIYVGERFCSEEVTDGQIWPKTPSGDTVINRTCVPGRVGYKSRTCEGTTWKMVYSYCVSEELNNVVNAADHFLKGLGATQEVAKDIFQGLKNSSMLESSTSDTMSDISASISAFDMMAEATEKVALDEDVLPDFVETTSNILNKTWGGINDSTLHSMSANYLESLEGLVKNVRVYSIQDVNSQNMELKYCLSSDCNISVFDVSINLNNTNGMMKTAGVKNLMDKLRNGYDQSVPTKVLVSVTLNNATNSSINITMGFPKESLDLDRSYKPVCVFWNITEGDWSSSGCTVRTGDDDQVICNCNHLTSFAVLMAKSKIVDEVLELISKVGLVVSVCSLVIFLIIEFVVWSAVVKSNLSHFRHTALVNIATFLLLADICFLASLSPQSLSGNWCLVLTMCKHLFYLAMFSWMLCMSVMLVHQLIFVFNPLRKRVFMFLSSIAGYVCPIVIVGSSYVYCKYTKKEYYDPETCWLVFNRLLEGSIHAFILPMGTIVLTNLFSMVVVIVTLVKTTVPDSSKADEKETAKSILKVVMFLTPVFGITWIIGFGQLMLDKDDPLFKVATYSFTILNSFQGLLILITGCIAEQKVREELMKLILAKSRGNNDSTKTLTSTKCTKDK